MENFTKLLQSEMDLKGFKKKTLSDKAGLDSSAVRKILNGSSVRLDTFMKLCEALGSHPMKFLDSNWDKKEENHFYTQAPIINKVSAGQMQEVCEIPTMGYLQYPTKKKTIFALKVDGDSMNEIAPNGSYAIVDHSQKDCSYLNKKPVIAASSEHDATFKILQKEGDKSFLCPSSTNPIDQPIEICEDWYIIGKVIGIINPLSDDEEN